VAVFLSMEALDWSLRHHRRYGDTDLFPRAFEFEVVETRWAEYRKMLAALDLSTHAWREGRSMLFMKDQVSFRRATQFDPIDSILFAALIWTIAPEIEACRPARALNAVFSYRFEASSNGQLFAPFKPKQAFWTHTANACKEQGTRLLTTDITDFYNQIRHSSIKSDLDAIVSKDYSDLVMTALRAVQGNSDVGIPVGPHSTHLLAELVLAPFDEYMLDRDLPYMRYADDVHVACKSEDEARELLYEIADYMHRNLQLSLSRHKTQVLDGDQMRVYARTALGPAEATSEDESRTKVDEIVEEHTSAGGDEEVDITDLDAESQESLSPENIRAALDELLDSNAQIQLRKHLRGLMNLHTPGAIDWVVWNIHHILPALPQAIEYLHNTLPRYEDKPSYVLSVLVDSLELPIVERSEHMQTLLLATCVQFSEYADFKAVRSYWTNVLPAAQREIVLLAGKLRKVPWIKTLAAKPGNVDAWFVRALVEAAKCLKEDDRRALRKWAEKVLGPIWLLDDPSSPAASAPANALLAPEVIRAAARCDVTVTFSESTLPLPQLKPYGGKVKSTASDKITFSGVDVVRLLTDARAGKLDGNGRAREVVEILLGDGECLFERLPDVSVASQAEDDVEDKRLKKVLKNTDVLIVTSAEIEKRAVLARFVPLEGEKGILVGNHQGITFRCGQFGRYAAAHVHTTQGPDGKHGATLTTLLALVGMKFKACLVIGIAFGFDRKEQRLGDVLIAEQVQPYEHAKIEGDAETYKPRGAIIPCGTVLSERFRSRMDGWEKYRTLTRVKLQQGVVLSGAKLVNSKPFRDRLLKQFKDLKPVGGEMEGHATYAAAQVTKVEIVLVKAICDWADGDKDDSAQLFAMEMAVDACQHLLSKPDILSQLKAKDLGLPPPPSKELPDVTAVLAKPKKQASLLEYDDDVPY
jgi:nucleoside phosphorylase